MPVAVFAALAAPGLTAGGAETPPRLGGAALAVAAVFRTRRLWAGLLAGMAGYWLLRVVV